MKIHRNYHLNWVVPRYLSGTFVHVTLCASPFKIRTHVRAHLQVNKGHFNNSTKTADTWKLFGIFWVESLFRSLIEIKINININSARFPSPPTAVAITERCALDLTRNKIKSFLWNFHIFRWCLYLLLHFCVHPGVVYSVFIHLCPRFSFTFHRFYFFS